MPYCRFCKSKNIRLIFKKQDLHIFKCADCEIVFLGNEIGYQAIKELYSYYAYDKLANNLSAITKLRYEKILDELEKYRKTNAIIDVGCGAGHFVTCAANRGWRVDGSEISDEAIELVEQKGHSVIKGDIASIDLEKERYDAATLFELMEHVVDPEGIIEKLRQALRPGGFVYITTPNYNSLTRRLLGKQWGVFHKEHVFYFTPKALFLFLKKHNFKIIKISTENLYLKEILNIFKKRRPLDNSKIYEMQESLRGLIEKRKSLFLIKRSINFFLNMCGMGETIYVFAQKGETCF